MRKVVCVEQQRPFIPNRWFSDPVSILPRNLRWHSVVSYSKETSCVSENIVKNIQ